MLWYNNILNVAKTIQNVIKQTMTLFNNITDPLIQDAQDCAGHILLLTYKDRGKRNLKYGKT